MSIGRIIQRRGGPILVNGRLGALFGLLALLLAAGCVLESQERFNDLVKDGAHLYKQGAYAGARETYQAAITLRPDDPELKYRLACCCEKMGDQAAAERAYHACLERDPDQVAPTLTDEDLEVGLAELLDSRNRMTRRALGADPGGHDDTSAVPAEPYPGGWSPARPGLAP